MLTRYQRLHQQLETTGTGTMTTGGGSMTPIFPAKTSVKMTYQKQEMYAVGDIVFCKVRGNFIDAHLITRKCERGYLISNNHHHDNGWCKLSDIYGKVIKAEWNTTIKTF